MNNFSSFLISFLLCYSAYSQTNKSSTDNIFVNNKAWSVSSLGKIQVNPLDIKYQLEKNGNSKIYQYQNEKKNYARYGDTKSFNGKSLVVKELGSSERIVTEVSFDSSSRSESASRDIDSNETKHTTSRIKSNQIKMLHTKDGKIVDVYLCNTEVNAYRNFFNGSDIGDWREDESNICTVVNQKICSRLDSALQDSNNSSLKQKIENLNKKSNKIYYDLKESLKWDDDKQDYDYKKKLIPMSSRVHIQKTNAVMRIINSEYEKSLGKFSEQLNDVKVTFSDEIQKHQKSTRKSFQIKNIKLGSLFDEKDLHNSNSVNAQKYIMENYSKVDFHLNNTENRSRGGPAENGLFQIGSYCDKYKDQFYKEKQTENKRTKKSKSIIEGK